ncbi:MAG: hypothetical protein ABGW74_08675 [Campylobacterales bacterium]
MDLPRVERELKKRWDYTYRWGRKQSNEWDRLTSFIYTTYSVNALLRKSGHLSQELRDYALNRWYNYWSAMAAEDIFASHSRVTSHKNIYDKLVDFKIDEIPFDHKTSIFPKGFSYSYDYAKEHEDELIWWLYTNQSQEGRKHFGNRLFIIMYDSQDFEHWKMKAEIMLMKQQIDSYMYRFEKSNLKKIVLDNKEILSDIIWVVR